ncbi:MAG: metal-dependent hydrolase [Chitinophagales bacterium]
MDSITQFALGAAMGEAVLGKKIGNKAILWGGLAGTIPDLDIIFFPLMDEVGRLSFHRGISHSLFFAFVVAPLLAWLVTRWYQKDENNTTTFRDWTLLFFLGLFTHPIIDAFTVYGTQLFLPFSDYRVGLNNVFILDPLYTVPLLLGLLIAMFHKKTNARRPFWNHLGIGLSTLYVCFTLFSKNMANNAVEYALQNQKIEHQRFMTAPTPLNSILWYSVVEAKDGYYMGLYSILDKDKNIEFEYFEKDDSLIENMKDDRAIDRLIWFSQGYYLVRQDDEGLKLYNLIFGKDDLFEPNKKNEPDYEVGDSFIFSFILHEDKNGDMYFEEKVGPPEDADIKKAFAVLWQRIKGK